MAEYKHSTVLFKHEDGRPMRFTMPPGPKRKSLKELVQHGGGIMTNKDEEGNIRIAVPGTKVSTSTSISPQYIEDCAEQNRLLDMDKYRVTMGERVQDSSSSGDDLSPASTIIELVPRDRKGRMKYLLSEDINIINFILDDRYDQTRGNEVWKKAQMLEITKHSWQSMKDRYVKHILPGIHNNIYHRLTSAQIGKLTGHPCLSKKESGSTPSATSTPKKQDGPTSPALDDLDHMLLQRAKSVSVDNDNDNDNEHASDDQQEAAQAPRRNEWNSSMSPAYSPRRKANNSRSGNKTTDPSQMSTRNGQNSSMSKTCSSKTQNNNSVETVTSSSLEKLHESVVSTENSPPTMRITRQKHEKVKTVTKKRRHITNASSTESPYKAKQKRQEGGLDSSTNKEAEREILDSSVSSEASPSQLQGNTNSSVEQRLGHTLRSSKDKECSQVIVSPSGSQMHYIEPQSVEECEESQSLLSPGPQQKTKKDLMMSNVEKHKPASAKKGSRKNLIAQLIFDSQSSQGDFPCSQESNVSTIDADEEEEIERATVAMKKTCSCLGLSMEELWSVMYKCNGSLKDAVSWILTNSGNIWSREDDEKLARGEDHEILKNKYGEHQMAERQQFLANFL